MPRTRRSPRINRAVQRKNRRKFIRTIFQFIILFAVGYWIVNSVVDLKQYKESDAAAWSNHQQFIALSYFGVARTATSDHISKKELDAQLRVLKEHGYETISQQDIIDFYTKGSPLPPKALFLAFEDGRNDSALFSTQLLEKFNYKATMLTYASNLINKQGKFLAPKDLKSMIKRGYWELGSNGYRLAYINIWNQNLEYFPYLTQEEFFQKPKATSYTHYLMDYIRDQYNIPLETKTEMEERISYDYDEVERLYTEQLGEVPHTYMIMHADSLYNNMDGAVEKVNDEHIRSLFDLHFNREGKMLNTIEGDPYDLTRVQPAPYWRTNHLLMKLQLDTNEDVSFVTGDEQHAKQWEVTGGVVEYLPEEIVLTTLPSEIASMKLADGELSNNFSLDVTVSGHSSGLQLIKLGQSNDGSLSLQLRVEDEYVYVEMLNEDGEVERLLGVRGKDKPLADINIKLSIVEGKISMKINNNAVMNNEALHPSLTDWSIELIAYSKQEDNRWEDDGDYIYDGVFKNIELSNLDEQGKTVEQVYSNKQKALSKGIISIQKIYNQLIDWAVETF